MADTYPSWLCQFSIRFEDFGTTKIPVPDKVPQQQRGVKIERGTLRAVPDPDNPGRFLIQDKDHPTPPGPSTSQTSSSDGLTHDVGGVIAHSFAWKQNGIRNADELQLDLKWADFPFDPRVIRSCAVRFFLGTVTAENHAKGIGGQFGTPDAGGQVLPLNVVPSTFTDENGVTRSNLRFTGWVDDYEMTWPDGEPMVKLMCRDQTQLFITTENPAGWGIDQTLHIDEAVAKYLAQFPAFEGITVEYRPTTVRDNKTPPILKDNYSSTCTAPGSVVPLSKGGGGSERLSVWDYLTDVCGSIGHIIRLDGNQIIIQRPRNIYNAQAAKRTEDPYTTRTVDGKDFPVRTLVYGRDVKDLKVTRKFSKTSTNIEVRSYLPERKKTLVARSPRGATKAAQQASQPGSGEESKNLQVNARPGDGKSDQKWMVKYIQGIASQEQLQSIADDVYEMMNRLEVQVHLKTMNLWSYGGSNEDPDLLDLRAGDSLAVMVDRATEFSTVTETDHALSVFGLGKDQLMALGYSESLASAHEKAFGDAHFTKEFYVKEVDVSGDIENGINIEVLGLNYVEARADSKPTTADDQAPR